MIPAAEFLFITDTLVIKTGHAFINCLNFRQYAREIKFRTRHRTKFDYFEKKYPMGEINFGIIALC